MEIARLSAYETAGRKGQEADLGGKKKLGVNLNLSQAALFTD